MDDALPVEFGNAFSTPTQGTGWIVGFSEWTRCAPFNLRHVVADASAGGVCIKWFDHPAGDPNGEPKPVSTGRSIALLVSPESEFRLDFSRFADFPAEATLSHTLRRCGDFVIWGDGIHHRSFGIARACIVTIRWSAYG